ncbi:MAG: hypothetical protein WAQ24_03745 [Candidatus Saccharimonadales bacterium]
MSGHESNGDIVPAVASPEAVATLFDPKSVARARVTEFLELTVEAILGQPCVHEIESGAVAIIDSADGDNEIYPPNKRLAISMLGLQAAVRTLCQQNPPEERDETVTATRDVVDGSTNKILSYKFSASRAGANFGTYLASKLLDTYDTDDDNSDEPDNHRKVYEHVLIPSDHYLQQVIRRGRLHESVFHASETDFISPKWSETEIEWLANGGMARRTINLGRKFFDENKYCPDRKGVTAFYEADRIFYKPLYNKDAQGIEPYLSITQKLLRQLIDALNGTHEIRGIA